MQDNQKQVESPRYKPQLRKHRERERESSPERILGENLGNEKYLPAVMSSYMQALWLKDPKEPNVLPELKAKKKSSFCLNEVLGCPQDVT